jgi:hypothetical protein
MTRRKLHLSTETLRALSLVPVNRNESRGRPCHTDWCSEGLPCERSRETCP